MMSAFFGSDSSERAGGRRSSRNRAGPDAPETWLSPPSSVFDEQWLLVAHQAHALWFNQLLCELGVLIADLDADLLSAAHRTLQRAERIAAVLVEQMRELRALPSAGRAPLELLVGGSTENARESLQRLASISGRGAPAIGRWLARERRPERPRSASVREAFIRALARAGGHAEVASRTATLAELQARLADPAAAARNELAVGLRALDDRLVEWAWHRAALCDARGAAEAAVRTAPALRFFPELWP